MSVNRSPRMPRVRAAFEKNLTTLCCSASARRRRRRAGVSMGGRVFGTGGVIGIVAAALTTVGRLIFNSYNCTCACGRTFATPRGLFAHLVPWLVLFATGLFAWGSFFRKPGGLHGHLSPAGVGGIQFLIATYGGYFGGGAGFLMVAALTMAGQAVRIASNTKNLLAGVMNASAVAIFLFSPDLHWPQALVSAAGATIGGVVGARLIHVIDEKLLRLFIIVVGSALTIGLFMRAG